MREIHTLREREKVRERERESFSYREREIYIKVRDIYIKKWRDTH